MNDISFEGQSFLDKEAAKFPKKLFGRSRADPNVSTVVHKSKNVVKPENAQFLTQPEKSQDVFDQSKKSGTGSIATDLSLWLTKKIPGAREPIENTVGKFNRGMQNFDANVGAMAAGNQPGTFRHNFFTKKKTDKVGRVVDDDGRTADLLKEDRHTSLIAPVEKTVKFTTPFLAAGYVADKLFPAEENLGTSLNQATYENQLQKSSSLMDESVTELMDKEASLQKIAMLETQIEKYAKEMESLLMDKNATIKTLEKVTMEKTAMEKRAAELEKNLLRKQAEHEELRLRTIAQKRSQTAVKLAEDMLETKLIKQAEYDRTVDKLMECDESTLKMYDTLVKEARGGTDYVETLSYIGEYKDNEKLAATSQELAKNSLSVRGQTMGEAARDLKQ